MEMPTKKEMLMDTTMRIVAQRGFAAFSMRQVTKAIHVSEALIYRHYETKENLLLQCFRAVDSQIADFFQNEPAPTAVSEEELYEYIHNLWIKFFTFMVRNGYKTIYYFEYRESFYCEIDLKDGKRGIARTESYSEGLAGIFDAINKDHHILDKISSDIFVTYILDITGMFAARVIRGRLTEDARTIENIWRMIYSGLSGLL